MVAMLRFRSAIVVESGFIDKGIVEGGGEDGTRGEDAKGKPVVNGELARTVGEEERGEGGREVVTGDGECPALEVILMLMLIISDSLICGGVRLLKVVIVDLTLVICVAVSRRNR